jgi:hypothetical protein
MKAVMCVLYIRTQCYIQLRNFVVWCVQLLGAGAPLMLG